MELSLLARADSGGFTSEKEALMHSVPLKHATMYFSRFRNMDLEESDLERPGVGIDNSFGPSELAKGSTGGGRDGDGGGLCLRL